jgi:hypothetical protein
MRENVYLLKRGEVLIGTLYVEDTDFPWVICRFEPTSAFTPFRPLFDEDIRVGDTEDIEAWDRAYEAIAALGLQLIARESGADWGDCLLHIQADKAWFR